MRLENRRGFEICIGHNNEEIDFIFKKLNRVIRMNSIRTHFGSVGKELIRL